MANPVKKVQIKTESAVKIKTEPGTSDIERLASFKLPRDLTLGGNAHRAKRTFTPNLNIVRNKNKSSEATSSTSSPTPRGGRGGRGRGSDNRGRSGRGRGKEFIQSQGIFSEGIGDKRKQSSWGGRSSSGGGGSRDDSANAIEKPKVDFKQEIKVDKHEEDQRLEDIFSKKGNYSNLEPDYEYAPITLPYRVPENDKSDIKKLDTNSFNILTKIKQEPISQANNLKDLLESEKQKYIFFQFPDSLPAFGSTPEPEASANKVDKKTINPSSSTTENTTVPNRCTLNDLSEGIVGKIVIYKSGRAKLILGSTEFNLELGMQRSFLQDVMSIETNSEKNDGKMINLGQIEGDIVVTPDWNYLLNNTKFAS